MHVYLLGDRGHYYDMIYGTGREDLCHYAPMEQCDLDP